MRGVFTAGVLDYFLEEDISFDTCLGVSAGSCLACSYLSKQHGRGYRTVTGYLDDPRYCGIGSFLKTGIILGQRCFTRPYRMNWTPMTMKCLKQTRPGFTRL